MTASQADELDAPSVRLPLSKQEATMTLGELEAKIRESGWERGLPVELQDDYGREFTPEVSFSAKPYPRIVVHIRGSAIEAETDG